MASKRIIIVSSIVGLMKLCLWIPVFASDYPTSDDYTSLTPNVFQSELVYPQPKGTLQTTFYPTFQDNNTAKSTTLPFQLEYGITDQWQLDMSWYSYEWLRPIHGRKTEGISDLFVGSQYSWMYVNHSLYSVSVELETQFPFGNINKGLTDGFIQYQPLVIIARDFP